MYFPKLNKSYTPTPVKNNLSSNNTIRYNSAYEIEEVAGQVTSSYNRPSKNNNGHSYWYRLRLRG
jgi:hypothetical protein